MEAIYVLGVMIAVATVFALIAKRFKQPLLVGYVVAGFILGPAVTGAIDDPAPVLAFFAEFGLILLLFVIGLELNFSKIKSLGKMSIILGTLQVGVVAAVTFALALLLGFETITAVYVGLIVAFSSTIVVVKLLSDKGELDTVHGNMILGILIVEDILAVVGLTLLGVLVPEGSTSHLIPTLSSIVHIFMPLPNTVGFGFLSLLINGVLFILVAALFSRLILPRIFVSAAKSHELMFVASLGVALTLAMIGAFFSFSLAIGAFVAGIALSSARFSRNLMEEVEPIKDIVLVLFFVALGTLLTFTNFIEQLKLIAFLFLAAILLKPVIIFFLRKFFRYGNRASVLVSLALAQISEFSLIVAMAGVAEGVLPAEFMTGVVIATLLSMILTAYFIRYDEHLYKLCKHFIAPIDWLFGLRDEERAQVSQRFAPKIIIIGATTLGAELIDAMGKKEILLVDKNPKKIRPFKDRGIDAVCSSTYNVDLYDDVIDFSHLESVISTVDDVNVNLYLMRKITEASPKAVVTLIARTEDDARRLYDEGAALVIVPDIMGGLFLARLLPDSAELRRTGKKYRTELNRRFEQGL